MIFCFCIFGCGSSSNGHRDGISGRGFFIYSNESNSRLYSRSDDLNVASDGKLINEEGLLILGFPINGVGALEPIDTDVATAELLGRVVIQLEIEEDGQVIAVLDDGQTKSLGSVALADFNDPLALSPAGDSLFEETTESGEAIVGLPGTGSFGSIHQLQIDLGT